MEEQSPPAKWEGEVSAEVTAAEPQEVWPLIADEFCSLHKWIPIDTCHHVAGVPGQPGLTRRCATTHTPSEAAAPSTKWADERLILIDPTEHVLSYEILDNNFGFKSYVATFKLLPTGDGGCRIVWSFVADPIEGWPLDEFLKYLQFSVQHMAEKMGDFLQKSG